MRRWQEADRWFAAPAAPLCVGLGVLVLLTVCVLPVLASPGLYVATMPHDTLSMADIGYRLAQGQRPGRDLHSAFGVLFEWQMGLAWTLAHSVAGELKVATLMFAVVAAALGAYVALTRLSNLGTLWIIAAVLLLGATPFARADANLGGVTYAMMYNREAWIFLLLALLFWLPARRPVSTVWEGLTLGVLLCLCVYFKMSYGCMALAFCGLWAVLRPPARGRVWIALATLGGFAGVLELIYGWGVNADYLSDIVLVGRAGGGRFAHIVYNLFSARAELIVACVLIPLFAARGRRIDRPDWIFIAFATATSLLIVWQNAQVDGLATLWAVVALALEAPRIDARTTVEPTAVQTAIAWSAWAVITLSPNGLALTQAVLGAWTVQPTAPGIAAIADIRFAPNPGKRGSSAVGGVNGPEYVAQVADGLALLQACPKGASLATFDMFEPFSQILQRPPNRGWSWRHFGHSFSMQVHPDAKIEFARVGCIMIPKAPTDPQTTAALLSLYGPYLDQQFGETRSSNDWTLRLRTKP